MANRSDPVTFGIREIHPISEIGLRRTMEDRHVVEIRPGVGLFGGVYDGHGGVEAAELVADLLHEAFFQAFDTGLSPPAAFRKAYRVVEDKLQRVDSGATAVTVFLRKEELTFSYVGDGGILLMAEQPKLLTQPHRVDDPVERSRIIAAGGKIEGAYVVWGLRGLMPTRSFGDTYFRPIGVMAEPTVGEHRLGSEDRYLVVACDGLFDVLETKAIAHILLQSSGARQAGESLRDEVLGRGGTDNLTILVIELTSGAHPSTTTNDPTAAAS